eukprot:827478-Prymnesium_polylepis.1
MTEFTATRPPLHTLAQAVEGARGAWRRRWSARFARAASGGGRRGWLNFKDGLYSALCNPRTTQRVFQRALARAAGGGVNDSSSPQIAPFTAAAATVSCPIKIAGDASGAIVSRGL